MNQKELLYVDLIKKHFSREYLNKKTKYNYNSPHLSENNGGIYAGSCYILSETLYHLLDDKNTYKIKRGTIDDIVHYWIENIITNEILDPSAEQFKTESLQKIYLSKKGASFRNISNGAKFFLLFLKQIIMDQKFI